MRFEKQLFRHKPDEGVYGDCWRTAVACVLDCDPTLVPHEHRPLSGDEQHQRINAWLRQRGVTLLSVPFAAATLGEAVATCGWWSNGLPYLLTGRSRNGSNHVVIGRGDAIIHDPAQDESGIVGPADNGHYYCEWLVFSAEPTPSPLPARAREALEFIWSFHAQHGLSPTFREVARAMGVASVNSASKVIHALEKRGFIRVTPGSKRSIVPVRPVPPLPSPQPEGEAQ